MLLGRFRRQLNGKLLGAGGMVARTKTPATAETGNTSAKRSHLTPVEMLDATVAALVASAGSDLTPEWGGMNGGVGDGPHPVMEGRGGEGGPRPAIIESDCVRLRDADGGFPKT